MAKTKDSVPTGLRERGLALWESVTGKYVLRADELVTLEGACRGSDRLAAMRDELALMPMMVTGSTGQLVVNPLVAEIRAHEAQVSTLLTRLKLPDAGASGASSRSTQARDAANSRWAAAHGSGT